MSNVIIVIFSVLLTASVMTCMFLFYLLKKGKKEKEEIILHKQEASSEKTEEPKQENDIFYDMFSMDYTNMRRRKMKAQQEGWVYRGIAYTLLECPRDSVYAINNKWINETATHNIKHISQITEKENAVIVGICNMTLAGPKGTRFVIEDIHGRVTTEPRKFKVDISANELQGRLVVFKGYIENGKFTITNVSRTKFDVA